MAKFRMTSARRFWWPVTVTFPDPDPAQAGNTLTQTFKVQFEEIPREEAEALFASAEGQSDNETALIHRVTKGWDADVVDDKDQPIPFSEDKLREAMQSAYFRVALWLAFAQSQTGQAARLGN